MRNIVFFVPSNHNPRSYPASRIMHIRLVFLLSSYLFAFSLQPSALLADGSAQALELILKNGDKLTGTLVGQTESHVVIEHPHLGEIEVAKSALQPLPASLQAIPPAIDASSPDPVPDPDPVAGPASPTAGPTQRIDQPQLSGKAAIKKIGKGRRNRPLLMRILPRDLIRAMVKMNARFGLAYDIQKSRKNHEDMRFYFNSRWNNGQSNFRFDTDYRFGEVNEEISEDRFQADFRFRQEKEGMLFTQTRSRYRTDGIREIDHFFEQHLGVGWEWVALPRLKLVGGPEVAVHFRDLDVSNEELGGWSYLGSFFQDSEFQISEVYQLDQEAHAYLDPEDRENWGYTLEMMLTGKISQGFSVRLAYEYNYDNQVPRRVPQEEISFLSSLMYTF